MGNLVCTLGLKSSRSQELSGTKTFPGPSGGVAPPFPSRGQRLGALSRLSLLGEELPLIPTHAQTLSSLPTFSLFIQGQPLTSAGFRDEDQLNPREMLSTAGDLPSTYPLPLGGRENITPGFLPGPDCNPLGSG